MQGKPAEQIARLHAIVRDLHWMARRYADMRMTSAPGTLNHATRELRALGVTLAEPHFARDGMGRRYDGLSEAEVEAAARDMPKLHGTSADLPRIIAELASRAGHAVALSLAEVLADPKLDVSHAIGFPAPSGRMLQLTVIFSQGMPE